MATILQLSNGKNWKYRYSKSLVAKKVGDTYISIPAYSVPILLESSIIAVKCLVKKPGLRWVTAGWISQKIKIGIGTGVTPNTYTEKNQRLIINNLTVVFFPQIVTSYGVIISVPYWLRDLKFALYEYTGIVDDSVVEKLQEINSKIDQLL